MKALINKLNLINLLILIFCIIISFIWGYLALFVYFILGTFLLIYAAQKGKGITKYVIKEYPEIYQKRKLVNRMTLEGDFALNIVSLSGLEINTINKKEIVIYLLGIKKFLKTILLSFIIIFILTLLIDLIGA